MGEYMAPIIASKGLGDMSRYTPALYGLDDTQMKNILG